MNRRMFLFLAGKISLLLSCVGLFWRRQREPNEWCFSRITMSWHNFESGRIITMRQQFESGILFEELPEKVGYPDRHRIAKVGVSYADMQRARATISGVA